MAAPRTTETTVTAASGPVVRRISWSAVFAGAVIAFALQFLLSLLGMSIGLWSMETEALSAFGMGAAIWWLVTSLVSVYAGAWVASRLAGIPLAFDGMIHGLLVWSVGTFVTLFIITSAAGALVGGAAQLLGRSVESVGNAATEVAPEAAQTARSLASAQGLPLDEVTQVLNEAMTGPNAARARQELQQIFSRGVQDGVTDPQFREQVVNLLTTRGDVDRGRAEELTDSAIAQIEQARQEISQVATQARETGEAVAHSTGKAAFWSFLALLVGAIAAALGGRRGARHQEIAITEIRAEAART